MQRDKQLAVDVKTLHAKIGDLTTQCTPHAQPEDCVMPLNLFQCFWERVG